MSIKSNTNRCQFFVSALPHKLPCYLHKHSQSDRQTGMLIQSLEFKPQSTDIDCIWMELADMLISVQVKFSLRNPLTLIEMACLTLLGTGKNPAQCADWLNLTEASVTTYEKRIRKKLGAHNRTHTLYLAIHRGYIKIAA